MIRIKHFILFFMLFILMDCSTVPDIKQSGDQLIEITDSPQNKDERVFTEFHYNLITVGNGSWILEWNLYEQNGQVAFKTTISNTQKIIYVLYGILASLIILFGIYSFVKRKN